MHKSLRSRLMGGAAFHEISPLLSAEGTEGAEGGGAAGADKKAGAAGADSPKAAGDGGADSSKAAADKADAGSWRSTITDPALAEHAKRFNSPADAIKSHYELRQKLSSAIVRPGKDAKPEEVAAYRKAMDIPDDPKGYEFSRPEHIDEDMFKSEGMQATLGQFAAAQHAVGASKAVVKAALDTYWKIEAAARKAEVEADAKYAESSMAALTKEWGPDTETNREFARRAAEQVFGDAINEARQLTDKSGRFVLDNPLMLRALAKIGREMGEGTIGAVLSDKDADGIQSEIDKYQEEKMAALAKGDRAKANALDQKQAALYARLQPKAA